MMDDPMANPDPNTKPDEDTGDAGGGSTGGGNDWNDEEDDDDKKKDEETADPEEAL